MAVAIALVYSSREVRVLREQLVLDSQQAKEGLVTQRAANDLKLMGYTMAIDRLFVEFPELRTYFYEDAEVPLEEPLRSQVLSTAELIVDLADSVTSMIRHGQLETADQEAWAAALLSYGRSQAVQAILKEYEDEGVWRNATFESLRPASSASIS